MPKPTVVARVLDKGGLECRIQSPKLEEPLELSGVLSDLVPLTRGSELLASNKALVENAWAYAKFNYLKVSLPTREEQEAAAKRADGHRDVAIWLADLIDDPGDTTVHRWCSGCFEKTDHLKVELSAGRVPAYLCQNCGSPTLDCADPRCRNMAVRAKGAVRVPRYCAEHRQEIPGFEKASTPMESLADYRPLLEYDKANLSRAAKLVGVGVALAATGGAAAFAAAPAIGGAVGSLIGGYSGAAASSYGLALLGGGAVASGGLGMAGGTAVVAVLGGGLGGVLGASVAHAYVREDKSFRIDQLCDGPGTPVVVCNGFLSESTEGWGEWEQIVTTRYPDSPVFRVNWGAKELKNLGILAGRSALNHATQAMVKEAAAIATKQGAKKLGPLGPILLGAELAKNPWHVAKARADKTGVVLADLLARTTTRSYVLVGHSLGSRVMVVAAQTLGTKSDGPRIEAAHLLGAAIGAKSEWHTLTPHVEEAIYNYHSTHDAVLKYLYKAAQAGQNAAGVSGFATSEPKIRNVDVSEEVRKHSDYHGSVVFR